METTRHNNKIFDPRLAQTTKIYPPPVTGLDMSVKNHLVACGCYVVLVYLASYLGGIFVQLCDPPQPGPGVHVEKNG